MPDKVKIIGPFTQILSMVQLPLGGPISNEQMVIRKDQWIAVNNGLIEEVAQIKHLSAKFRPEEIEIEELEGKYVLIPGIVDAHTHICFAGSRHLDYSERNEGVSYLDIAKRGGGIWDSVNKTRKATFENLHELTCSRANSALTSGITTMEIKSGYGLNYDDEIKMLEVINTLDKHHLMDIVPTCLAAHMHPKDFEGSALSYLEYLVSDLLVTIKERKYSNRIDIFIEDSAFTFREGKYYLDAARQMGFDVTVHGDQFNTGGSQLAIEMAAVSVDHLEASGSKEIEMLGHSDVVAVVLPGASLGLGCNFAPARKLLDAGTKLAIASDWNPGSAPMGDLLTQASILGAYEKLSDAEVIAGLTFRAAAALNMSDRGRLDSGYLADFMAFSVSDYREILYHQGQLKPSQVWKKGKAIL